MAAASTDNRSYLVRHWRGELSVVQSYWVNTVGINMLLGFLVAILGVAAYHLPLSAGLFFVFGIWLIAAVALIWQTVGIVRASRRHLDHDERLWVPLLALGALLVIWVNSIVAFVQVGAPQISDAWNILQGDPQWPDSAVTLLPTGKEIEFTGAIKLHSAQKLARALDEHPAATILHLETVGGREREASAMADLVRQRGLTTYVGGQCASAGVIVFLAGKQRILRKDARLGFHSARAAGVPTDQANARLERILTEAGADSVFIEKAVTTPANSMWYPTPRELLDEGLATQISDGTGFSLGTREIARYDAAGLREDLGKYARFQALALKEPELYDLALTQAAVAIRQGYDMRRSLREVNKAARQTMLAALPFASEAALDGFVDFDLEVMRRNMYRNPLETLGFLHQQGINPTSGRTQPLPDYPLEADDRLEAAVIASPIKPVSRDEADTSVLDVLSPIASRIKSKEDQDLFYLIPAERLAQIKACELWQELFLNLKKSPARDARALERYEMLSRMIKSR